MNADRIFQGDLIPEASSLVGYAYLVRKHSAQTFVRFPTCVSKKHIMGSEIVSGSFYLYDKRYFPGNSDIDHLVFALKHEAFDLLSLKRILILLSRKKIEDYIISSPSGVYARKICFLYEWLTEKLLNVPDCPKCATSFLLDPEKYITCSGIYLKRYRLKNNLLGSRYFVPVIRQTPLLQEFVNMGLKEKTDSIIGKVSKSLIARAASFLLLSDSKASFAIEGDRVPISRIERWGKAVMQAGKFPISVEEFVRLQKIIIADRRFTNIGLRKEGVFLGERDTEGDPLPEFIGSKPEDLAGLMSALVEADNLMTADALDPVLHAAVIAFGFIYIHPFEDGNGRLHRYLIHHVLAANRFSPSGVVFPISSSMLNSIELYRDTLRNHSSPLMDYIEWKPTDKKNVHVLNDTRDLYSYFDCTEACEYLYSCIQETVEKDLPEELNYLKYYDRTLDRINSLIDIPDNLAKSLIVFIRQNDGVLSKKRRNNLFSELTDGEVSTIEDIIKDEFLD